jgi:plasmid stabilization system protein ParE
MRLKPIRLRSEAELEIEQAFEFYLRESSRIADRFLKQISASQENSEEPTTLSPYTKNTRRRILGSFPFSVIHQEKEEVILIVAIAHAKRREGYWTKRLNQ